MSNTFGELFRLSIFGDSHGPSMGGIIDGCPSGLVIDENKILADLQRRQSGTTSFASARKEPDKFTLLSGISQGKTTGGPIGFLIPNKDSKRADYQHLDDIFRPSHADFTYYAKYGTMESAGKLHASGRIFVPVVLAGSIAKQILALHGIRVFAYVRQIGTISTPFSYEEIDPETIENSPVRCPDKKATKEMLHLLDKLKKLGDSTGGIISGVVEGCPPGLGDPVFGKLQAKLAQAMFSINAVKGFEYGSGFAAAGMKGSEHNDLFVVKQNRLRTATNNSGGIQGGISNGEDIYFSVAFKPVPGIKIKQKTVNRQAQTVEFSTGGRHDVCFVPRAIPVVEAMTALVVTDSLFKQQVYAEKQ
ncbi:MAG TPA: chorismate synthase [Bacteroidales bacterium]|nr:chorismate synthase [Bacteroidales bacterium]HNZ43364.1 chorismate synthase [Bacteroidales bacterium]HPB25519.1 chorismate synthase [Bacteroidales bacterium]HPI30197.1 chorismate synthase [Bacteroidales bacterium]HQN16122.1 chorismate synthase [Bacteroidales bacterium]